MKMDVYKLLTTTDPLKIHSYQDGMIAKILERDRAAEVWVHVDDTWLKLSRSIPHRWIYYKTAEEIADAPKLRFDAHQELMKHIWDLPTPRYADHIFEWLCNNDPLAEVT